MITDDSIKLVGANCPQLKSLKVSWSSGVTDESIKLVATNCRQLCLLNVSGTKVTKESHELLAANGLHMQFPPHQYSGHWVSRRVANLSALDPDVE